MPEVKILPAGPLKRIHVNGALIRAAQAKGRPARKPYTLLVDQSATHPMADRWKRINAKQVQVHALPAASVRFRYCPDNPLTTHAILWVETDGEVAYA